MKLSQEKKRNILQSNGGVVPFLGIAVIMFLLTVAVYFVANYVSESYTEEARLSNWSYLFTEKAGVTPEAELRLYNAQNPIVTDSGKKAVYFTKTLDASDTAENLVLITDYSPLKIKLNGREIYNNQFDAAEFVGNCYNAVRLEPSTHERVIEVFMKLPFSVRFETTLGEGGNPAFSPSAGFILGLILMGIGLLALVVFAILSAVKKRFFRSIAVAGIIAYVGFAIALHLLPEVTYLLNTPIWLRLEEVPVHLTLMPALACLNARFKDHRKATVAIFFASLISAAAVLLSFTPLLVKLSLALMCVLCLAVMGYTSWMAMARIDRRIQYATPVFVMCVYYTMMALFAAILLVSRQRVLYIYDLAMSTVVVACAVEYFAIADYRFERNNTELRSQSTRYGSSVDHISQSIRNMLHSHDKNSFYETAVGEIVSLLVQYNEENAGVRYCVALKNGAYEEILNSGVGGCHYEKIEANALESGRSCLFAETYFEYVLRDGGEIGAVFHFENIRGGLDVFFVSMIEAIYCGLETTYENTFSDKAHRDINVIFEELAENAELDNGSSIGHLGHICTHSRELCLRLGMDEARAEHIALASRLHDLGKIAIPKSIIEKQGRLSEEERVIINSHTEFGYTILAAYDDDPLLATAATIARYHHERWDGDGYNGLKGEEIPLEARIVTVCDVYDALVSERSYKKAWSVEDAREYLHDNAGKVFDPAICETFLKMNENQS